MASNNDTMVIKTIAKLERRNSSTNGNPAFMVFFTDGTSARTQTDAAFCYEIENPEYRDAPIEFTFTPAGRIRWGRVVKQEEGNG